MEIILIRCVSANQIEKRGGEVDKSEDVLKSVRFNLLVKLCLDVQAVTAVKAVSAGKAGLAE